MTPFVQLEAVVGGTTPQEALLTGGAFVDHPPFTGNGFVGKGENAIIPEYHLEKPVGGLPTGAEMWRIQPVGTESLVAVLRKEGWVRVVGRS